MPINQKNGTFRDVAVDSEVADNSDGVAQPALLFPNDGKEIFRHMRNQAGPAFRSGETVWFLRALMTPRTPAQ